MNDLIKREKNIVYKLDAHSKTDCIEVRRKEREKEERRELIEIIIFPPV